MNSTQKISWLLVLVFSVFLATACDQSEKKKAFNVVLITADTTRIDDLEPFGGPTRMPALSKLASEGVKLNQAFTVATATGPAHASLFTASYPKQHGIYNHKTALRDELVTLADVLSSHQYTTAAFISAPVVGERAGFSQGFHVFSQRKYAVRRGDHTTEQFIHWLKSEKHKPFFSWIHFFDPHQPYNPPTYEAPPDLDESALKAIGVDFSRRVTRETITNLSPGEQSRAIEVAWARYHGEIEHMDAQIGRIVSELDALGQLDDTLIIFVADHGENFDQSNPALVFEHYGIRRDVIHIPLLLRFPSMQYSGTKLDCLVGNIDIGPTILDFLQIDAPEAWIGKSFLENIRGSDDDFRDHLVIESVHQHEIGVRNKNWYYREVGKGFRPSKKYSHHLAYLPNQTSMLFNLSADPKEFKNLLKNSGDRYVKQVSELRRMLADFRTEENKPTNPKIDDPEHAAVLEALGYTD